MPDSPSLRAFLEELRRRRVYRVAAWYFAAAFVGLQVAQLAFEALPVPESLLGGLLVAAVAGFPVAVVFAWLFEVTAGGIRPEQGGPLADFVGRSPAARLAVGGGVVALSAAAGMAGWVHWIGPGAPEPAAETPAPELDPARIAVMYFDDHSENGELGYLADGLTEGLIHELGQVDALEVVSRSGVKPFRDSPAPFDSVVAALRVGSVVEGSVVASGERIRLTVQLIDGARNSHIESMVFERDRSDLLALQTELSREVAEALRSRLGREIALREARAGTESVEAWSLTRRARSLFDDYAAVWADDRDAAERVLLRADSVLMDAEAADPEWVEPKLLRGEVSHRLALLAGPVPGRYHPSAAEAGLAHAERALAAAPDHAGALELRARLERGLSRVTEGDRAGELRQAAGADYERAVRLDPDRADAWIGYAEWLVEEGRMAEAARAATRAREADAFLRLPHDVLHIYYYAVLQEGPVDEARAACDEGHARFPTSPDFVTCQLYVLASFPDVPPDVARAWTLRDSLAAVSSEGSRATMRTFGTIQVAKVIARAGLPDSVEAVLRAARGPRAPDFLTYDEAHVRVLMGDTARAIDLLERSLDYEPDTALIAEDWWFEPLREVARFRRLVGADR